MDLSAPQPLVLDYGAAAGRALLDNLSGLALAGGHLWSVSDEGRTLECLRADGDGFTLARQYRLDDLLALPGLDEDPPAELDLEAIAAAGGRLFIAGSHGRVRKKPKGDRLNPNLRDRPGRNLLAAFDIGSDGVSLRRPAMLPTAGRGSLRRVLAGDDYLSRFLELPSKENGLDVEGLAIRGDEVLLGLRGPLLDSLAVVIGLRLTPGFGIARYDLYFLDLDGLGIRDLEVIDGEVLVLAGPVSDAHVPFRLYRTPLARAGRIDGGPALLAAFAAGDEKPEGICRLVRNGTEGLAILMDHPDGARIEGSRYRADWFPLASLPST